MPSNRWIESSQERRDEYFLAFARGLLADGDLSLGRLTTSKADRQHFLEAARQLAEEAMEVVDS